MAETNKRESKFKVGDRVLVIDGIASKGMVGVVKTIDHDAHRGKIPIVVVTPDEAHHGELRVADEQLELA